VSPSPPRALTISSGAKGSTFANVAARYGKILARDGIKLNVLESAGSQENLSRLSDAHSGVDIAPVQSGIAASGDSGNIVSLSSMFYEIVAIFYRTPKPIQRLSELRSLRIAVGPEGSGTRTLALTLLKANGIEPGGPTQQREALGELTAERRAQLLERLNVIERTAIARRMPGSAVEQL